MAQDPIDDAKDRIENIIKGMLSNADIPKDVLAALLAEVSTIFEEVNTANEEIRVMNESLILAHREMEKERQNYQELFYYAPDAYLETDMNGKILQANLAAQELFNISDRYLNGKPLSVFVTRADRNAFFNLFHPMRKVQAVEVNMQPRSRTPFVASISLVPVQDQDGKTARARWLIRDITQNKVEQAALAASEERFRTVFIHSHVGMMLTDMEGRIVESNLAFEQMIGYIQEELLGLEVEGLLDPKDRVEIDQIRAEILEESQAGRTVETRYLTKNEQEIWVRQTISVLPDMHGKPVYFMYLMENITAQRQSDEELAEMKRRMIESIESERLHLAQELHDGPIQDLYGAVFKLKEIPGNGDPARDNIKETHDLIKQVAGTLRVICGDLRPPTLSNFGLDRAMQTHAEQIQDQNKGIEINLKADRDDHLLSQEVRLGLFRIYQQCMANAIRHSQAHQINIHLEIGDEEVSLMVEDDGVGFEPPTRMVELLRTGHYGLAGIAERVESLNGSLIVDSSPGSGTRITVEIPRQVAPTEQR